MKKLFVVSLVLVGLAVSAWAAGPSNPYWQRKAPDYLALVQAFVQTEPAGFRKQQITQADLPLLELWFSDSAMYVLFQSLPITSWQQLHDLKYVSISSKSGKPRALCSETKALELMILFDLAWQTDDQGQPIWPWAQ